MSRGYKQSQLGDIPKHWSSSIIEKEASICTGGKDTQDKIEGGQYPFFVRSNTVERINSYSFEGEAVLTSGDGVGVGKIYHYLNCKFDYHQRVYNIHNFSDNLNGKFFYYFFSSHFYQRVMRLSAKNSVDSVRRNMIAEMEIPIPPLPEQQKIAKILSTVDDKIEIINQQIQETKQLKKGMMQRLLTKGVDHTEFKDSPLGEIPKSWEVVTVREITKEHKQGYYTKDDYTDKGVKLARITDLNNPKVDYTDMPFLDVTKSDFNNYKIEKGDFLFARSGAIGRYGIVEKAEYPAIFASYLIRFRFKSDIVNRFFGYFFESNMCSRQLSSITQGNANVNINAENIKSLKFPFAPYFEQQKIAKILTTIDDKLEVLSDKKGEYQQLKKGLMQQLLTGKVRVKV